MGLMNASAAIGEKFEHPGGCKLPAQGFSQLFIAVAADPIVFRIGAVPFVEHVEAALFRELRPASDAMFHGLFLLGTKVHAKQRAAQNASGVVETPVFCDLQIFGFGLCEWRGDIFEIERLLNDLAFFQTIYASSVFA